MKPKSLLKRVVDFARAELERRAKLATEAEPEARPHTRPAPSPVGATPAAASATTQPDWAAPQAPETEAAREPAKATGEKGLEVIHAASGLKLSWDLSEQDVANARVLLDSDAVLCVRVVAFSPLRDDVMRQVRDRPSVGLQGSCEVGPVDNAAVVAIGLRAGERFVSIAHHTL